MTHPRTWTLSNSFNPSVIQHEFGHNLGLNHQYTAKYNRIPSNMSDEGIAIGPIYDGESRMGAEGDIDLSASSSEK